MFSQSFFFIVMPLTTCFGLDRVAPLSGGWGGVIYGATESCGDTMGPREVVCRNSNCGVSRPIEGGGGRDSLGGIEGDRVRAQGDGVGDH